MATLVSSRHHELYPQGSGRDARGFYVPALHTVHVGASVASVLEAEWRATRMTVKLELCCPTGLSLNKMK